jgi:tetratricopeptide (TPR) repeat protein
MLAADPHKHWAEVLDLLILAIRKRRAFALEIVEVLDQDDLHDELTPTQKQMVQLVKHQLRVIEHGKLRDGLEMFEALCRLPDLAPQTKGYLLAYRGECFRQNGQWEKALHDFQEALQDISEDTWTLTFQGDTYRMLDRYSEALMSLNKALLLDANDDWALAVRGATYLVMDRYGEALADFDRAIALDEKEDWYRYCRAQLYLLTGQTQAASNDIRVALELAQRVLRATAGQTATETYRVRFNIAFYLLFGSHETEAEALYHELLSTCSISARLQAVKDHLDDFLTIQPNHPAVLRLQSLLQARIEALRS